MQEARETMLKKGWIEDEGKRRQLALMQDELKLHAKFEQARENVVKEAVEKGVKEGKTPVDVLSGFVAESAKGVPMLRSATSKDKTQALAVQDVLEKGTSAEGKSLSTIRKAAVVVGSIYADQSDYHRARMRGVIKVANEYEERESVLGQTKEPPIRRSGK